MGLEAKTPRKQAHYCFLHFPPSRRLRLISYFPHDGYPGNARIMLTLDLFSCNKNHQEPPYATGAKKSRRCKNAQIGVSSHLIARGIPKKTFHGSEKGRFRIWVTTHEQVPGNEEDIHPKIGPGKLSSATGRFNRAVSSSIPATSVGEDKCPSW